MMGEEGVMGEITRSDGERSNGREVRRKRK